MYGSKLYKYVDSFFTLEVKLRSMYMYYFILKPCTIINEDCILVGGEALPFNSSLLSGSPPGIHYQTTENAPCSASGMDLVIRCTKLPSKFVQC